jgi:hypothetical protein
MALDVDPAMIFHRKAISRTNLMHMVTTIEENGDAIARENPRSSYYCSED